MSLEFASVSCNNIRRKNAHLLSEAKQPGQVPPNDKVVLVNDDGGYRTAQRRVFKDRGVLLFKALLVVFGVCIHSSVSISLGIPADYNCFSVIDCSGISENDSYWGSGQP